MRTPPRSTSTFKVRCSPRTPRPPWPPIWVNPVLMEYEQWIGFFMCSYSTSVMACPRWLSAWRLVLWTWMPELSLPCILAVSSCSRKLPITSSITTISLNISFVPDSWWISVRFAAIRLCSTFIRIALKRIVLEVVSVWAFPTIARWVFSFSLSTISLHLFSHPHFPPSLLFIHISLHLFSSSTFPSHV